VIEVLQELVLLLVLVLVLVVLVVVLVYSLFTVLCLTQKPRPS
jgi:hypothetical protein